MQRDFRSQRVCFVVVLLLATALGTGGAVAAEEQRGGDRSTPVSFDPSDRFGAVDGDHRSWRRAGAGRRGGILDMFRDDRRSGLALPVSRDVSFGVGYEYVTPEDLAFEVAETGSLTSDYESHEVMIRAAWRF